MTFKDIVLYVTSGTGNTYRVAQWMKEIAESKDTPTDVMMIDDVTKKNRPVCRKDRLFGVMFPAHGLMAPWSMIKFLLMMPWGRGASLISVSTRGGIKLGPIVIPGAVGVGNYMAVVILLLKGYRIRGWYSVDMPVNMINLHWGMHPKNVDILLSRSRKRIETMMNRLFDGRFLFFIRNNIWEAFWGGLLFWLIPVFPIIYLLFGKLFMGKLLFSDNRCIGCGLCAKFCPNQGVVMKKIGKTKRPFWTYHCEACLRCMGYCKKQAIEAGHSWGVLVYYITTIPIITFFLRKLNPFETFYSGIEGFWTSEMIKAIDVIPALLIAYWGFWLLLRIPVVNTLFSYTTLTRYLRRYHEPGTRLKKLKSHKKS